MKYTDKARYKVFRFVEFVKHMQKDTTDGLKQTVNERAVNEEKWTEILINGKNQMSVGAANQFKRHFCRTIYAVFIATGGAKFRMTAKRNKFELTATRTSIHGTAIGRIPTINHLLDIFHDNRTRMENVLNFLIMFFENLL